MKYTLGLLILSLVGCSLVEENDPCIPSTGTYHISYQEMAGDCGELMSVNFPLSSNFPVVCIEGNSKNKINLSHKNSCSLEIDTLCRQTDGKLYQQEGTITWSPADNSGTGSITLFGSCLSTYKVLVEPQ